MSILTLPSIHGRLHEAPFIEGSNAFNSFYPVDPQVLFDRAGQLVSYVLKPG